jgi:hypothetical protein
LQFREPNYAGGTQPFLEDIRTIRKKAGAC